MPRWFHRNYLWLVGVVCGIIISRDLAAFYPAVIIAAGLIVVLSVKHSFRNLIILSVALLSGLISGWYCCWQQNKVLHRGYFENIPVRINDAFAIGQALNKGDIVANSVQAINLDNGLKIQLRLPRKLLPHSLGDGEVWRISGIFEPNPLPTEYFIADKNGQWHDVSAEWNSSSYDNYLAIHDIAGRFYVRSMQRSEEKSSFSLMKLRRAAAGRLDEGISDPRCRAVIGALILGMRSRLSSDIKHEYTRVGVAHLFSVSGLHVGVMALLILLALRPIPLTWSWVCILTLGIYVALTGGNAPAIRAFCMVMVIVLCKAHLLWMRSLELLSLIAAVLLVINPYYITDGGFQYSFIVTAMLIKASTPAGYLVRVAGGDALEWGELPRWKMYLLKWRGRLAGTVFYAAVAFFSSGVLVLYHQQNFFGGSMLVNLLVLPVLTPLFLTGILKMLLPWLDSLWNLLLEGMIGYLEFVTGLFDSFTAPSPLMAPHYLWVMAILVMLWLLLEFLHCRYVLYPAAGLILAGLWLYMMPHWCAGNLAVVITGGDLENPHGAILLPVERSMYVMNCGRSSSYIISDLARRYGIGRIARIDFTRPVADCVDGLDYLRNNFTVEKFCYTGQSIRSRVFRKYVKDIKLEKSPHIGTLEVPDGSKGDLQLQKISGGRCVLRCGAFSWQLDRTAFTRVYLIPLKYCK
ncbi:MAG: ComEC/Rec2 family competence protein [Lentisphaerae bacterium]|nr:ComEC/Rec2 family competence protein [Lentisphaerota bacterium]